jgi:hypothetical protein
MAGVWTKPEVRNSSRGPTQYQNCLAAGCGALACLCAPSVLMLPNSRSESLGTRMRVPSAIIARGDAAATAPKWRYGAPRRREAGSDFPDVSVRLRVLY